MIIYHGLVDMESEQATQTVRVTVPAKRKPRKCGPKVKTGCITCKSALGMPESGSFKQY
jgi:hypothetical protein